MILLIIGTSSSGKTTLAKSLQRRLDGYWQYMGLDVFFAGMPEQYGGGLNGPLSQDGFSYQNKEDDARIAYGEIGKRVLNGMIASAIAFHEQGVHVIFDDMILDEEHAQMWQDALQHVDSLVVHLSASEGTLRDRNEARGNPPNLAINHVDANTLMSIDLKFNTEEITVDECVQSIAAYLNG